MYEKFFGFTIKPFNVTPDTRFLYLSPSHQEALASMIYGIKERRGFVSIIGEIGTGKTTLLHTLFNELESSVKSVFIFNTKINFIQLLQSILIELELVPQGDNKVHLFNQLNDFLIERLAVNENVALIIDEAQNLSSIVLEEIRMLSNLETSREKLLQIVLVGQPDLDSKLRSPRLRQLKQRISINCYLTPLNQEEQIKYIQHRLAIAKSSTGEIFTKEALALICKHSKGIPRIINILCDNALLSAYGKELHKVDEDIVKDVILDYEKPMLSSPEAVHGERVVKKKKTRFRKSMVAGVIILIIIGALIIGITFFKNDPVIFNRLFDSLYKRFSIKASEKDTHITNTTVTLTYADPKVVSFTGERNKNIGKINTTIPDNTVEVIYPQSEPDSLSPPDLIQVETENKAEIIIPEKKDPKIVTVKFGDMVSSLALKEYGILNDTIFDVVKRANPQISDLDKIDIGQDIILPPLGIDSSIVETENSAFAIHVATFSTYNDAIQLHNQLAKKKLIPSIVPVPILGKQKWYRVLVGNFTTRAEAVQFAKTSQLFEFL